MRFVGISALLVILSFAVASPQPAGAAQVTREFSGAVTGIAENSSFDFKIGDVLSVRATYDSGLLTGIGDEILSPTSDSSLTLVIDIGSFHFEASDDTGFPDFPEFEFSDGKLVDINFVAAFDEFLFIATNGFFSITGNEDNIAQVQGAFVIPEPVALTLFGAGLAGMGLTRRRRNSLRAA
jgi:hypothetical protein